MEEQNNVEQVQTVVTPEPQKPKKSKKGLIITIIIFVLLAVGGLTTWLIMNNNGDSDVDEPNTEEKNQKKEEKKDNKEIEKEQKKENSKYLYIYKCITKNNDGKEDVVYSTGQDKLLTEYDKYEVYAEYKCISSDCHFLYKNVDEGYNLIYDNDNYYLYNAIDDNKYKLDFNTEVEFVSYNSDLDCVTYRDKDDITKEYCYDYKSNKLKYGFKTSVCYSNQNVTADDYTPENYLIYYDDNLNVLAYFNNTNNATLDVNKLANYKTLTDLKNYLINNGFKCE